MPGVSKLVVVSSILVVKVVRKRTMPRWGVDVGRDWRDAREV
jgi:hypothetical protein